MRTVRRVWKNAPALLVVATAMVLPGCLCSSKCTSASPACVEKCEAEPRCSRGNVYVFLVNGFDPLDLGKTGHLRTALGRLGFAKVYSGQFYHAYEFGTEIAEIATFE